MTARQRTRLIERFRAAAWLAREDAALTDLDAFPPGSGDLTRRTHHARSARFEATAKLLEQDGRLEDGELLRDDGLWAAEQAGRAKDPATWRYDFSDVADRLNCWRLRIRTGCEEDHALVELLVLTRARSVVQEVEDLSVPELVNPEGIVVGRGDEDICDVFHRISPDTLAAEAQRTASA